MCELLHSGLTFCSPIDCSLPRDSPGKNTGVGCCFLLQGIFLTQGSNPHLLSPALAGGFFTTSTTWESPCVIYNCIKYDDINIYILLIS